MTAIVRHRLFHLAGVTLTCALALSARIAVAAPEAGQAGTSAAVATDQAGPAATAIPICVPIGLAVDKQGNLFVSNHFGSGTTCGPAAQITVYGPSGNPLPTHTLTGPANFNPAGLAFDKTGNLYVSDYANQAVYVYDAAGKRLLARTLHTDPNFNPSGVQVDKSGSVWVANRTNSNIGIGEIQIFSKGKVITTITQGLVYPVGIAFQPRGGTAWVGNSERPNDSLSTYSPKGKFLKAIPTPGFVPTYLQFGNTGNLYVTDGLDSVLDVFNTSGQLLSSITAGLALPYGIAFTPTGDFYVANVGLGGAYNGSSVTKYSPAGKLLCTITTGACK